MIGLIIHMVILTAFLIYFTLSRRSIIKDKISRLYNPIRNTIRNTTTLKSSTP